MSKNCAIILAGGKGKRMKAGMNKQFLEILEKPILCHTLESFSNCDEIDEIILVSVKEEIEYCISDIVNKYNYKKVSKVVEGGKERQDSVLNGLKAIDDCDIVLIHDGARPFVDQKIIHDGIKYAREYYACACGVVPKDTIKLRTDNSFSDGTINRDKLFIIQTPQCFKYELILNCHEKIYETNKKVTDDTMVVEEFGHYVYLYDGSYNNIKITTPEDLIVGEKIATYQNQILSK